MKIKFTFTVNLPVQKQVNILQRTEQNSKNVEFHIFLLVIVLIGKMKILFLLILSNILILKVAVIFLKGKLCRFFKN